MRRITRLHQFGDLQLDCELEYDAGQRSSLTDPAHAPAAYIVSAKVGGVDVITLLSPSLIDAIEEGAVWDMQ